MFGNGHKCGYGLAGALASEMESMCNVFPWLNMRKLEQRWILRLCNCVCDILERRDSLAILCI